MAFIKQLAQMLANKKKGEKKEFISILSQSFSEMFDKETNFSGC